MPFIDLQCRKLFTIKVASSGHMTVLEYRRKNTTAHVRTHPDDGERRKELHIQRCAILVEAKTGSQRALIDYRKILHSHTIIKKYRVTSGIFRAALFNG